MAELQTLPRKNDSDDSGFDSLKREGLRLIQEFSGEIWTDYNLHDPGVTILDQLCYALTELIYRADFPVEDFLAGADGGIDLAAQALHPPEAIFPARPTTAADLREAIFGQVAEIDDVWIDPVQDARPRGLYRVAVRLHESVSAQQKEDVLEKVRGAFCRCRNLCEDIAELTAISEVSYELYASIEISKDSEPAEVLAGVYHTCACAIADGIRFTPFADHLKAGRSLEAILTGPFNGYGVARDGAQCCDDRGAPRDAELRSLISALPGVEQVRKFSLSAGEDHDCLASPGTRTARFLKIPEIGAEPWVTLTRDGKEIKVSLAEMRSKYDELHFRHRSMRRVQNDLSVLRLEPHGVYRELREYYSIQNDFPAIYGVNALGLPASAPAELKGKTAQLKGYLLLFEQLCANFNSDLAQLRSLFSPERVGEASYSHQVVQNEGTPPLHDLYSDGAEATLAKVVSDHDPCADRGNRLLDYLLALYGETFPAENFQRFDCYTCEGDAGRRLMTAKRSFLRSIVSAGRDRGAGLDYLRYPGNHWTVPGLQRRVSLILGFKEYRDRALAAVLVEEQLMPVRDREFLGQFPLLFRLREGEGPAHWEPVPRLAVGSNADRSALRKELAAIIPVTQGRIAESLLLRGVSLENFRVIRGEKMSKLVFTPDEGGSWWRLASYGGPGEAFRGANLLCRFLTAVSEQSEGLHVIEHILLRARSAQMPAVPEGGELFYSFRVSVVFPGWTARCCDPQFREMAEETVVENCPAHVFPDFYWLSLEQMSEFEKLYQKWLELLSRTSDDPAEQDQAAADLVSYLKEKVTIQHNFEKSS